MKYYYILLVVLFSCAGVLSCRTQNPNVPIYFYPPQDNQTNPYPSQNVTGTSKPPLINNSESAEHDIIVDRTNNVFSIGIPAGYEEKTEVTAQKPIDFWFEYLTSDVKLEINGAEVQRNPFIWETRIGYTKNITKFSYNIINTTGSTISYNLHLVPSNEAESVSVVVYQTWIP